MIEGLLAVSEESLVSSCKEGIQLTSGICSSQSFASTISCVRLSELPTSRTMLGKPDGLGAGSIPESACFFFVPS